VGAQKEASNGLEAKHANAADATNIHATNIHATINNICNMI
jgi:hypothetical protein